MSNRAISYVIDDVYLMIFVSALLGCVELKQWWKTLNDYICMIEAIGMAKALWRLASGNLGRAWDTPWLDLHSFDFACSVTKKDEDIIEVDQTEI